jgi:snapalysin
MVRAGAVALFLALPLLGAQAANAAPAPHSVTPHAATIVYYDDESGSAWSAQVATAVQNWNSALHNVQLQAGDSSNSTVTLQATSGWPETQTDQPGSGTVSLGQQAVDQGYDKTRIAAHELGHILGLPDNYNGDCSILMSGHSAGTSCTNAHPGADEAAQVDQIFANGGSPAITHRRYVDVAAF